VDLQRTVAADVHAAFQMTHGAGVGKGRVRRRTVLPPRCLLLHCASRFGHATCALAAACSPVRSALSSGTGSVKTTSFSGS